MRVRFVRCPERLPPETGEPQAAAGAEGASGQCGLSFWVRTAWSQTAVHSLLKQLKPPDRPGVGYDGPFSVTRSLIRFQKPDPGSLYAYSRTQIWRLSRELGGAGAPHVLVGGSDWLATDQQ